MYFPLQLPYIFHTVVTIGIVNDRYGKSLIKTFQNGICIVARSDKIDIVRPLCDQFIIDLFQTFYSDLFPFYCIADLIVLAIDTP